MGCQFHRLTQYRRPPGSEQSCSRIRQHDIPSWPVFPGDDITNHSCALSRRMDDQIGRSAAGQPHIFHSPVSLFDPVALHIKDGRGPPQRNLVQLIRPANHQGPRPSQLGLGFSDLASGHHAVSAEQLKLRLCRIRQWAEQIKDGPNPELLSHRGNVLHGLVQ